VRASEHGSSSSASHFINVSNNLRGNEPARILNQNLCYFN
jgi:hypothetical protein